MMENHEESLNAQAARCVKAIEDVDHEALHAVCTADVEVVVPGARDVDLTIRAAGIEGLCDWVAKVRQLCGMTRFSIDRYFENGCQLMASGTIHIQRLPREFSSPCSLLLRFESGKIAFLQLLLDSFALEKFRGQMD